MNLIKKVQSEATKALLSRLAAEGLNKHEAAKKLGVSYETVCYHASNHKIRFATTWGRPTRTKVNFIFKF